MFRNKTTINLYSLTRYLNVSNVEKTKQAASGPARERRKGRETKLETKKSRKKTNVTNS